MFVTVILYDFIHELVAGSPIVISTALSRWTHMNDHSYAVKTADVRGIYGIIKSNVSARKHRSVAGMECAVVGNVK
jgi:hypothetical protein